MELLTHIARPQHFHFKKGEILFLQGNRCDGVFYLQSGTAKLYTIHNDGKESIHHLISPGEFAGIDCFLGHEKHEFNAKAMEDLHCYYLSQTELETELLVDPQVASFILKKLGKVLDDVLHRNANFVRFGVKRKMADCLIELANSFGEEEEYGLRIKIQISRDELASLVGVAPETAIRFISEFKRRGVLEERDRHLIVKNTQLLRQLAEETNIG